MDNRRLHILIIIVCLFLPACGGDDVDYGLGEYKVDLVTVAKQNNADIYFVLDNGKTLFSLDNALVPANIQNGQRVLLNYSFTSEKTSGFDYTVKINYISGIVQGNLEKIGPADLSALKNDPVQFESVWIGGKYLNMTFYFDYHSGQHQISLVRDTTIQQTDIVYLQFRHDRKNDPPGSRRKVIASFDLSKALGNPEGNKELSVEFNTTHYGVKSYHLEY